MGSAEGITDLEFYVNGSKVTEPAAEPDESLLHYLRRNLFLTGTKEACGEGACGACTVMVSNYDHHLKTVVHRSQAACITPVVLVHGQEVTTVEGIGNTEDGLHPVQEQLAATHGTQCGFCSPGFVMAMYSLLQKQPEPTVQKMESTLSGNICRCTGYRPILQGMAAFCKEATENKYAITDIEDAGTLKCLGKYDRSGDAQLAKAIAARLEAMARATDKRVKFVGASSTWHQPKTLDELVKLKTTIPDARLISAATTLGFLPKKPTGNTYIVTSDIPELKELKTTSEQGMNYLHLGAGVTIAELMDFLEPTMEGDKTDSILRALLGTVTHFDSPAVANVATVGGNVAGASPTSDINVFLLAVGADICTRGQGAARSTSVNQEFFPSYRKTRVSPQEVITHLKVPLSNNLKNTFAESYKEDKASATVNAVFSVTFEDNADVVKDAKFAFGGIGPTPLLAKKAQQYLVGKSWTEDTCSKVCSLLYEELGLPQGAPGGAEDYRNCLVTSLFFRFFVAVIDYLKKNGITNGPDADVSALPVSAGITREGIQFFEDPTPEHANDIVGCPVSVMSAQNHASGQAVYIDDIPRFKNELNLVLLLSPKPRAKIVSLDKTQALKMPGVKLILTGDDIPPENNYLFPWAKTQFILTEKEVEFEGQPIAAVIAETRKQAEQAVQAIKVEYEDMKPIITVRDAIAAKSFLGEPHVFPPNATDPLEGAPNLLEGELEMGLQKHIYMETQRTIAVPTGEKDEMDIYLSTQDAAGNQGVLSRVLKVDKNKVKVHVKRVGGAFGGKHLDSMILATPAALAAKKLKCPVRAVFSRYEDMLVVGGRHDTLAKYKVGYTKEGKILGLDITFYLNAGYCEELPWIGLNNQLLRLAMAYNIPKGRITLQLCKTNTRANTAVRAVAAPTGLITVEHCLHAVAQVLSLPAEQVQERNLIHDGDTPFTGQVINDPSAVQCFQDVMKSCDFIAMKDEVAAFNRENAWRKRGIYMVPTAFGVSEYNSHAMALVHIYMDGSVLVGHSGIEMGQGVNTKMIQLVTRVLEVPVSKVHIKETNTDITVEGCGTGGSTGTDMSGMAVKNACEKLMAKLAPFKDKQPGGNWEDWVKAAYDNRVELSETGAYWVPPEYLVPTFPGGQTCSYITYGAGCSQVEVDCLTGNTEVLSTNIIMDVGKSINPMIDVGQIEGGFLQGYGLFMKEEERYRPDGKLVTTGLGTYKVPRLKDIPQKFNVRLLKGRGNPRAVYSSKGIGEPPLYLAASVYFATKMAVASARKDAGLDGKFTFSTPATPERIRLACGDKFTKMSAADDTKL